MPFLARLPRIAPRLAASSAFRVRPCYRIASGECSRRAHQIFSDGSIRRQRAPSRRFSIPTAAAVPDITSEDSGADDGADIRTDEGSDGRSRAVPDVAPSIISADTMTSPELPSQEGVPLPRVVPARSTPPASRSAPPSGFLSTPDSARSARRGGVRFSRSAPPGGFPSTPASPRSARRGGVRSTESQGHWNVPLSAIAEAVDYLSACVGGASPVRTLPVSRALVKYAGRLPEGVECEDAAAHFLFSVCCAPPSGPDDAVTVAYLREEIETRGGRPLEQACLPHLLHSLASRPSISSVGNLATGLHLYLRTEKFTVDPEVYVRILAKSRFRGTGSVRYNEILEDIVRAGGLPPPHLVSAAIVDAFPHRGLYEVKSLLRAALTLIERHRENGGGAETGRFVTAGALELLFVAATTHASPEVANLCWDAVELQGMMPLEMFYECTVTTFLRARMQDHHAFTAFAEMQKDGFVPSGPFVVGMSKDLSTTRGRVGNAYNIICNGAKDFPASTQALNCVLGAYAELGSVDDAFWLFDEYASHGVTPDIDTYASLLQAVAREIILRGGKVTEGAEVADGEADAEVPPPEPPEAVGAVEFLVEDVGVVRSGRYVHWHVAALVCGGRTDLAVETLRDAVGRGDDVLLETFRSLRKRSVSRGSAGENTLKEIDKIAAKAGYAWYKRL